MDEFELKDAIKEWQKTRDELERIRQEYRNRVAILCSLIHNLPVPEAYRYGLISFRFPLPKGFREYIRTLD